MKKRRQNWLLTGLRFAICAFAIYYLYSKVPWRTQVRLGDENGPLFPLIENRGQELVIERAGRQETIPASAVHQFNFDGKITLDIEPGIPDVVKSINIWWAVYGILLFAPVWFIQSYRLVLMVDIQGVRLSYWNAIKLTFAGNFFNFALPGTTGGDVIKAYYLTRYTHLKTEVVTTVFLDRAIGLLGCVILAAGGIMLMWDPRSFGELALVLTILMAALIAGCIVTFSRRIRAALHLSELAARLPGGAQLLRIGRATLAMRQHKGKVALALAATLMLQLIVMISAAVMGWALGLRGPGGWLAQLTYFVIYVSIGFVIAAIPISPPQAIGVMEAAYVKFFTQHDLNTASQAVTFALAVRLIQLVWAIPGVLVPLLGGHLPPRAELDELESAADTSGAAPLVTGDLPGPPLIDPGAVDAPPARTSPLQ